MAILVPRSLVGSFSSISPRLYILENVAPQIEFSIQLTEKDIGAAADVFPFRRRLCVLPGVAASLLGIAGTVALIFLQPDWLEIDFPNWLGIDFGVIALGLVLIGYGTLMPKLHRWLLIRQFYRTPAAQKEMSYQVFDDHIVVRSELHYSELRWQAFQYAREIPGYLYLQTSPITGYIIPLTYLTPIQASQLRELVKGRVPRHSAAGRRFVRPG